MGRLRFFLDILSFNSPFAKVINISGIFIILAFLPQKMLSYSPFQCIFKNFIFPLFFKGCQSGGLFAGCFCPGCGLTRGLSKFLHGDFSEAIKMNILTPLLFSIMLIILIKNLAVIISSHYRLLQTRR